MKQEISALMDGELYEDQADGFLARLKRHPETQQDWEHYHLIGDVLRQPDHICKTFGKSFHDRLQSEPTIFAPHNRNTQRIRNFALSAVASVMALALVAWMSMQVGNEPAPQIAVIQPANPATQASAQAVEYLKAHQEFSPSADMRGNTTYVHAVAGR